MGQVDLRSWWQRMDARKHLSCGRQSYDRKGRKVNVLKQV